MAKNITGHMIVRNEDRFVWYAISSVLPYLDRLIIFDTGSDDGTAEIIKSFDSPKIEFDQKSRTTAEKLSEFRQEQIKRTRTDWIWIVDGDEIYPRKTCEEIVKITGRNDNLVGIIVHRYDLLGDIYHCQDETVGSYNQFGKIGHYVLRLINKRNVSNLKVKGEYPNEYFADSRGQSIKDYGREKFAFIEKKIFHAMYLQRSTRGGNLTEMPNRNKYKIELGRKIPPYELPEIFSSDHPAVVADVVQKRSFTYTLLATIITPLKYIYRNK